MLKNGIAMLAAGLLCANAYADNNYSTQPMGSSQPMGERTSMQSPADKNKQVGDAFLAANKAKPGVVTLPDGLQYKVITEGNGAQPTDTDTVTVHYAGTLINGTEFDSSYKRGQPMTFPVNAVIPGWVEALKLMKAGSTWEVYIPSNLAYGEQGAPPSIGPNETLIFKINLIGVEKGQK